MKKRFLIEENIDLIFNTALNYTLLAVEDQDLKADEIAVIFTEEDYNTIVYVKDVNNSVKESKATFVKDIKANYFNQFYDKLNSKLSDDYDIITIKY